MKEGWLNQETCSRLMRYSAAAGLGAFAFGSQASDALAEVVYVDLGGIQINRGEYSEVDVDGDGSLDFRMQNTTYGGIGGYGTVQFNTSVDSAWYGLPVTGVSTAAYAQINMDAPSTKGTNAYYVRSFIDGNTIGPSNPQSWDETGTSGGRLYGLLSQYPGWDQNSFWNPSPDSGSYGYDYNEYTGLRMVDINGDQRWAWVRFQVVLHDVANENSFPIPDGKVTRHDFLWDTNRYVVLYDYAYESDINVDIIAGDMGGTPPIPGDLNGDGFVGLADLDIILNNWNQTIPPGDPLADPTGDNFVGLSDLDIVLNHWNEGTPAAAAVPEPGALGLLAAGAGALSFKRRRNG